MPLHSTEQYSRNVMPAGIAVQDERTVERTAGGLN